jgi:hypothetical protein
MKIKNFQYRAILFLVIRLFLTIACQVAQSGWQQDGHSPHQEGTSKKNIERDVEHGYCDMRELENK